MFKFVTVNYTDLWFFVYSIPLEGNILFKWPRKNISNMDLSVIAIGLIRC